MEEINSKLKDYMFAKYKASGMRKRASKNASLTSTPSVSR